MGSAIPKQFIEIEGKPILFYTLRKFEACDWIRDIVLIISPVFESQLRDWIKKWGFTKIKSLVPGGKERQDSVYNGLKALSSNTEIVLIHDAVRPFVSQNKIKELISTTDEKKAAILAVPTKNTVKEVRHGVVQQTVNRDVLWQVQTPQGFHKSIIVDAYEKAMKNPVLVTDDAMFVESLGRPVYIVQGEELNFKITSPEDLDFAKFLINTRKA